MGIDQIRAILGVLSSALPGDWWLAQPFALKALVAIILVSTACASVGGLVISGRMAFFSDALAHCAFAGVTLGALLSLAGQNAEQDQWVVPLFMVVFGIIISLAIAFVRDNSALASDTIIGVFFALAVGFGGMMLSALNRSTFLDPEKFLFGSVLFVTEYDLIVLAILLVCVGGLILPTYNANLLSSFNASLARSRGIRVTLWNYLFIVVLALIVNLCLKAVGALLINALLVVPAATAANISRSARGMFWWTLAIALLSGVGGLWISCTVELPVRRGEPLPLAPSGTIVVVAVTAFFLSLGSRILRDRLSPPPSA